MRRTLLLLTLGLLVPAARGATPLQAALERSEQLLAQGKYAEARKALEPFAKPDTQVYELAMGYAELCRRMRDFEEADVFFERAAQLGPSEYAPLEGRLRVAREKDDPDWYSYAVELLHRDPDNLPANVEVGRDEHEKGDLDAAARSFGRALRSHPADPDALAGLGWCRLAQGENAEARELFEKAARARPGDPGIERGLEKSRPLFVEASPRYTRLGYSCTRRERGGSSAALPLTLAWHERTRATLTYTRTLVGFNDPLPSLSRKDWNLAASYQLSPETAMTGSFERVLANDPALGGGKLFSLGVRRRKPLPLYPGSFYTFGGYAAYSRYPAFTAFQLSPKAGAGLDGWFSLEFGATRIREALTSGTHVSYSFSGTAGPYHGVTMTISDYGGRKLLPVEDWGSWASETTDTWQAGWRWGLSWTRDWLTAFLELGQDQLRNSTYAGDTDYQRSVTSLGVSCRFRR